MGGYQGALAILHYNVEMADSGQDNYVVLDLQETRDQGAGDVDNGGTDCVIRWSGLTVRRYNNRESTVAPLMRNVDGVSTHTWGDWGY